MAVEAPPHNMNLFPSQLLTAREMMKPNLGFYTAQQTEAAAAAATPLLQSTALPFLHQSDSGLTCHVTTTAPTRKRSRDSITTVPNALLPLPQKNKLSSSSSSPPPSILDQELLFHFQNQQSEIDRFIVQHTEKVRMEMAEQRVRQSRMLITAIQEAVAKKLKEKDEEIQRVGKLNWVLQERVKSICVENQIWKELAQTNEATANNLRNNLEQVLAHVSEDHHNHNHHAVEAAESSCASNNNNNNHHHREEEEVCGGYERNDGVLGKRMCNQCGVRESIVLLLPCRHLCLCTMCGSTVHNCPLCQSGINASVHVNYS
ncbi:BOI-related E3 ubiquitin-protein ligase 1 [Glycine soja]